MFWNGLLLGLAAFVAIGAFHPIVIKCEYYFSAKVWPVFLAGGVIMCVLSTMTENIMLSATLAIVGFSMLWSIKELKEQQERVRKGWFPKNPHRSYVECDDERCKKYVAD